MLKQGLIYLLLSIVIVVFAEYAQMIIVYLDMLYTFVNLKLAPVFSQSELGVMIRRVFSLVVLPILIAAIPALIYRLIKGKNMPYFIQVTWLLWLVIVLSKILIG
ncbi:hypothetical protein [Legionella impletisoli]|uniref:Uncharacterized protein n=1 Tax=Legionella impletisoli TaxID=343510 RepID=A0A917JS74_9GAMM|nr:hypothetical protein [Legionella impletisoli]GGI79246.1 hypothetical protein GCM10007966_04720 [Legionella impletisoli]